jgi:hypothetical protein
MRQSDRCASRPALSHCADTGHPEPWRNGARHAGGQRVLIGNNCLHHQVQVNTVQVYRPTSAVRFSHR